MALDGLILNNINELIQPILPLRINKISQISQYEIVFECFNQQKYNLLISTDSNSNRLVIMNEEFTRLQEPSHFIMLLRKYCENGIIQSSQQIGLDRVIEWKITNRNDLGDLIEFRLMIELMGKYANIILVDNTSKIIDAFNRIAPYENSKRTIFTGAIYDYPEIADKQNPFETQHYNLDESLVSQFHGFSPLLSREVEYRIKIYNQSFLDIINKIKNSNQLIVSENLEFHLIELLHLNLPSKSYDLMDGLQLVYQQASHQDRIKQQVGNLNKIVKRELKRQTTKAPKLQLQLVQSKDYDKYRVLGDLLLTYGHLATKGDSQITLNDFEGYPITIELDKRLSPQQNAQKYYQRYRKLKVSISYIEKQIEENKQQISYLENILHQLQDAEIKDAQEIHKELVSVGLIREKKVVQNKKPSKIEPNSINYKDHTFYFGKSNIQNDYLTFKFARKNDWWFHIADGSGSHVVVSAETLDEPLIRFGANLAAYHSKYQHSSSVKVTYTQVNNIKKIPSAPLGMVQLLQHKTIFIDPQKPEEFKLYQDTEL